LVKKNNGIYLCEEKIIMSVHYKKETSFLTAVDCIIFGFDGKDLKALLIKRGFDPEKDKWSLMGGFVKKDEAVDAAAVRILNDLTGLDDIYMEQVHCFGDVERDAAARVISITYFALIKIDSNDDDLLKKHNAKWFNINKIPPLVFDHKKMLVVAKERLRQKVANHPIGFELLPEKFTLLQLQNLYETIYEQKFDNGNFSRKILSLDILMKLKEKEKSGSKKGSFLFVFDEIKYKALDRVGMKMI
jgi:8-oxo-dGTP diphosphatase